MTHEIFKRSKLIPFLMAGDPSLEMTGQLALSLADEGVEALELGVPFSDAFADGPVIQQARQVAEVANAVVVGSAFMKMVEQHRKDLAQLDVEVRTLARDILRALDED